jgi:hypothetical protein
VPFFHPRSRRITTQTPIPPVTLFLVALFAAACTSLPIVVPDSQNSFAGISGLLSKSRVGLNASSASPAVRVLIIHGMGTPQPNQFDPFILSLANRLRLVQVNAALGADLVPSACGTEALPAPSGLVDPAPAYIQIDGAPHEAQARLYTYDFAPASGASAVLSVAYLYWAPLTEAIKCATLAETGAPQRQWFADVAKQFIDDKLGDVVLYAGRYRDRVMRPSVQAALCMLIDGKPSQDGRTCSGGDPNLPTVLISHSLGGYMLMDSIDEELRRNRRDGRLNKDTAAYKIMENTQFIYMMANQIALLDLTELDQYPLPVTREWLGEAARPTVPTQSASPSMIHRFSEDWLEIRLRSRLVAPPEARTPNISSGERQIVAFSDPNDILSWLVGSDNVKREQPKLTNVYLSNHEFSIPWLFSDPVTAHTGYFTNNAVLDLLVCGMTNGAVAQCTPDQVQ